MPLKLFILSVEDDADDVELLQQALHDNKIEFKMEVVKSGDKVLPWLEQGKKFPDVIVMDLNLPKMHGKEILQRLNASEKFKQIPVVILTTSSAKEDVNFCLKNGAREFITKPATVEGFNKAVATIVLASQK